MVDTLNSSVFSLLFAIMATNTMTSAELDATLGAFHWQNRVVLSFASEQDMRAAQEQRDYRTKALGEWRDRDLVLVEVGPRDRVFIDREPQSSIDGAGLREKFAADADGFIAILVGKDGYEKFRSERAIANETLFATIDAMPMRQREMQRD